MKRFGLLGKTLGHSFSKNFFDEFFRTNAIEGTFENFEIEQIDSVKSVFECGVSGLSVTIPYKEAIIPYLDDLSPEAKLIGAVNCVQFINGKCIGHNTDAYGFHQSIKPFLTNLHERALILGTGGASKAVAHVFRSLGIDVIFCSRNPKGSKEFSYEEINNHMLNACKVIVNTTPVGTYPDINDCIPFPFGNLSKDHLVIDLIYNPALTKFLQLSKENGATVINGEAMLKHQALRSWKIWNEENIN